MKRAAIVGLISLIVLPLAFSTGAGATTKQVNAFNGYTASMKADLAPCASHVSIVQGELGQLLASGSSVPAGTYAQLLVAARTAEKFCNSQAAAVKRLATLSVPSQLNSIGSLRRTSSQARHWVTTDIGQVLRDVEQLVSKNGQPYAAGAALDTDTVVSDSDAASLRAAFSHAAQRLHTSFAGLGLVVWASQS